MNKKLELLRMKTITGIEGLVTDSREVSIKFEDGSEIFLYHMQDCCESVTIEQVDGNIKRHIGAKFISILEKVSREEPEDSAGCYGSCTWTFYTLVTTKGYLDFRWVGESNGYYSEDVDMSITIGDK